MSEVLAPGPAPSSTPGSVPVPLVAQLRVSTVRSMLLYTLLVLGITAFWAVTVWTSQHLRPDPVLHDCALFVHLASLVAGMGGVLTLDWFGARWLLGQHTRAELMRLTGGVHSLIWLGLAGLMASGTFLQPDVTSTVTRIKLAAVLVVALNGVHAHALSGRLESAPVLGGLLVARAGLVAGVSQAGWWTAVVVGFLNSR